jgi:hypothetical protein
MNFEQWLQATRGFATFSEVTNDLYYKITMKQFDMITKPSFMSIHEPEKLVSFPMTKSNYNSSKDVVRGTVTLPRLEMVEICVVGR